jgi:hypothetical protein
MTNSFHLYSQPIPFFDSIIKQDDVIAVFFIQVIVEFQKAFYHEYELITLVCYL